MFGMMQSAAGAVISNGEWGISFFSQVLVEKAVFYSPIPNIISSDRPNNTIFQYPEYAVFDQNRYFFELEVPLKRRLI